MEGISRKPGVLGMVGGGNHVMCGNGGSHQGQRLLGNVFCAGQATSL